jgi:hypothetical protein
MSSDSKVSSVANLQNPINCLLLALMLAGYEPLAMLRPVLMAFKRKDELPDNIRTFLLEGIWSAYVYWRGNNDQVSNRIARGAKNKLAGLSAPADLPDCIGTLQFLAQPALKRANKRKSGRGGDHKTGTRSNQTHLIRILIRLYTDAGKLMSFHSQEQKTDGKFIARKKRRPTGWGGPLERFVRAGLEVVQGKPSSPITQTAIKRVFQRMKKEGVLKSHIL